jgi:hypothetical protein
MNSAARRTEHGDETMTTITLPASIEIEIEPGVRGTMADVAELVETYGNAAAVEAAIISEEGILSYADVLLCSGWKKFSTLAAAEKRYGRLAAECAVDIAQSTCGKVFVFMKDT